MLWNVEAIEIKTTVTHGKLKEQIKSIFFKLKVKYILEV